MIKIYWCHRRDTNQSEPCLNPSGQNLSIRRFNKGQLYDLSRLRGTALEAETIQWSCQQKHWCGVFPDNFRPLCQRRHLQNVKNLQVGVFHSMSKVWQQHICRQMKFSFCYHSEILLAATTGRHSAAAGVTADTRSASFSTGIPKCRDLFKSRLLSSSTDFRPGPHFTTLHFGVPNSTRCFMATWFVVSSIICSFLHANGLGPRR